MLTVLNIIVILIVGLIAYWWANQGLFSAILHLVCVIVAGAVALAFWEPIATGLLIRGGGFDDYAWGVTLVSLFAVALFVLRLGFDKLAPANVDLPRWANLAFGGVLGAIAGVLTMGLLMIGLGHIQASSEIIGFRGWQRDPSSARIEEVNSLWLPVHKWTSDFYGWLSVSSLATSRPLRHYNPDLYKQATLLRDSYANGHGKLSLEPVEARVGKAYRAGDCYFVEVHFSHGARDWGERLTLSAAQIRLIENVPAGSKRQARTIHPHHWYQWSGYHKFDHVTHLITSQGSEEALDATIGFRVPADFDPAFIQIRGTRYRVSAPVNPPPGMCAGSATDLVQSGTGTTAASIGGGDITSAVEVDSGLGSLVLSANTLPASMKERDRKLTSGSLKWPKGGTAVRPSRPLRINGIYEPDGTRLVKVNVSRSSPANIFDIGAEGTASIQLLVRNGSPRSPIGYIYLQPTDTSVELRPEALLRNFGELPTVPTSGDYILHLLFYVNIGDTVTGLRVGETDIGSCQVEVTEGRR